MREPLFLIIGKSGSGKDYVVQQLTKMYTSRYKAVLSRSTRSPRFKGERTHNFVTMEQAIKDIPNAIASTEYDEELYYITEEDLECKNLYVVDIKGALDLITKQDELNRYVVVYYLDVPLLTRIKNMKKRGDSARNILERIKVDRKAFKDNPFWDIRAKSAKDLMEFIDRDYVAYYYHIV